MIRTLAIASLLLASCVPSPAPVERAAQVLPEAPLPEIRRFTGVPQQTPAISNAQLMRDFLELSFALETGRALPRFTRFEGPVTVAIEKVDGADPPGTLSPDLDDLILRLRTEARIDIRRAQVGEMPSITVSALPRAKLQRFVPGAACFVVPRVTGWRDYLSKRFSSDLDWTTLTTRTRASVFLPEDVSPQEMRDCLHEEIAQALGPLNDLYRLPHSIFNDDNVNVVLTDRDMAILRATYDPGLRSGMSARDVAARLPAIMNQVNPRGRRADTGEVPRSTPDWVAAIRGALNPRGSDRARLDSAYEALSLAQTAGWRDERLAFSLLALGRASLPINGRVSIEAFLQSGGIYRELQGDGIHSAQVALQLSAFALSSGDARVGLRLADRAIPAARDAQNAVLLSTLLLIRSEALQSLGRPADAEIARTEGLAWGRYAWGDGVLQIRAREVAGLTPGT